MGMRLTPLTTKIKTGSLIIVGTGIQLVSHISQESQQVIQQADKVFFLVGDPAKASWITQLNPQAESLHHCYATNKPRRQSYQEMVALILEGVRQGLNVCAVFYGHPGVFVNPSHAAIAQAGREGYSARMLPAISAEDCLFADLELEPLVMGCQRFEATDFLNRAYRFEPTAWLILWQVGTIDEAGFRPEGYGKEGLYRLVERLQQFYPADHQVIVYEAAIYGVLRPVILPIPLSQLPFAPVTPISTLCIPPLPS